MFVSNNTPYNYNNGINPVTGYPIYANHNIPEIFGQAMSYEEKLVVLAEWMARLKKQVEDMLDDVNNALELVENAINNLNDLIEQWVDILNQYVDDLNEIKQRLTVVEGDVNDLQTDLTQLTQRVSSLESRVTTVEAEINDLQTNLTQLTQRVSSLESRVTAIEGDINRLTDRIQTLESLVDGLGGNRTITLTGDVSGETEFLLTQSTWPINVTVPSNFARDVTSLISVNPSPTHPLPPGVTIDLISADMSVYGGLANIIFTFNMTGPIQLIANNGYVDAFVLDPSISGILAEGATMVGSLSSAKNVGVASDEWKNGFNIGGLSVMGVELWISVLDWAATPVPNELPYNAFGNALYVLNN